MPTHAQATMTAPAVPYEQAGMHPGSGPGEPRTPSSRRAPRRGRRLLATVPVALLVLVLGVAAASSFLDRPPEEGAEPAAYAPGYVNTELTSPDTTYEFDLKAGKVVPGDTATWYLARDGDAFVVPEESDAFIAAGDDLSVADCVRGIETQPVTALPFTELADERPFCVRSADQKDIAIVRLVEAASGGGPVTVAVERHHRETAR